MLKLTLRRTVYLNDAWMTRDEWEDFFAGNRDALIELLDEDIPALIDDCGGVDGLVESAEWEGE